jgi:hypothetical protein
LGLFLESLENLIDKSYHVDRIYDEQERHTFEKQRPFVGDTRKDNVKHQAYKSPRDNLIFGKGRQRSKTGDLAAESIVDTGAMKFRIPS